MFNLDSEQIKTRVRGCKKRKNRMTMKLNIKQVSIYLVKIV